MRLSELANDLALPVSQLQKWLVIYNLPYTAQEQELEISDSVVHFLSERHGLTLKTEAIQDANYQMSIFDLLSEAS